MLTDVEIVRNMDELGSRRLQLGVYESKWFNFELEFRNRQIYELDYPEIDRHAVSSYGVCDGVEQLLTYLRECDSEVLTGPRKFVISVTPIRKNEQPPDGGWRWHKWGPYIGIRQSVAEYLFDEPEIDEVWVYHIYEVKEDYAVAVA